MIRISLFGAMRVEVDGRPVTGLSSKQRQILAILALHADVPVTKERLADLLWEGAPPASYVATLDSYVCVLRRHLGLRAGRLSPLATTEAGFLLSTAALTGVEVDLVQFHRTAARAVSGTRDDAVTAAEEALDLSRHELLAEVQYADWAVRARERCGRLLVETCAVGAQRANGLGEPERALRLASAAVDLDPLCEEGWRQLMLAHWFAGHRSSALAAYARLRTSMLDLVGDEPGHDLEELYLTILRDTARTGSSLSDEEALEIRMLLNLLRQALDSTPGVRAPASDEALSSVAVGALARAS